MAPVLLVDLNKVDLNEVRFGPEEIEAVNPQRYEMRQLDGICYISDDQTEIVGFKDVKEDEFWVRGHIPGRPLFPGVLMIEAAAQLAAFVMTRRLAETGFKGFVGFVGADNIKFRSQVVPGQRLYLLGREVQFKRRRFICAAQGIVDGNIVFEVTITGMPI